MKKFYFSAIAVLLLLSVNTQAQNKTDLKGSVTISLDNSKNGNQPVETAYIILDKYDLTGAGYVKEKYDVANNRIIITDLPAGKYYADIYTKGIYQQHFARVIDVTKKGRSYTFKLDEIETYTPDTVVIPGESNDFSKTSIVLMK